MDPGTLYIIASPIGNLEDITIRAINTLKEKVDIVYCEDTRQTRKLLNHYNIALPAKSLHSHSSERKINQACEIIQKGESIAYLSDSGTPGLSDPGSKLVNFARKKGIKISPIPGPSALTSLVSVSGFPEKNIIFTGFLSKKKGKRKKTLEKLRDFNGIIIIYESPYRITKLIEVLYEVFPEKEILIGREMTKIYEEFIFGKIAEVSDNIDIITQKGEFTVAVLNQTRKMK